MGRWCVVDFQLSTFDFQNNDPNFYFFNIIPKPAAMKKTVLKTFLPTLSGIITVLFILIVINVIFFNATAFKTPDYGFFKTFVPITTTLALAIQFFITLPVWKQFVKKGMFIGMKLIPFTMLVILIFGVTFGFVFWERNYGLRELVATTLTGIVAFTIYWFINITFLRFLEKRL